MKQHALVDRRLPSFESYREQNQTSRTKFTKITATEQQSMQDMASTDNPSCPVVCSSTMMPNTADSDNNNNNRDEEPALPPRGVYHPPRATDTRGPCPMLNTLANHGYIPRSGRGIQAREITSALHDVIGVSWTVALLFTHPIFFVHRDPPEVFEKWWKSWSGIRRVVFDRPLDSLIFRWGMRAPGQYLDVNDEAESGGKRRRAKVINLDQLGTANAIEHDISLTRRDRGQSPGGCMRKQPELVEGLLNFKSLDSGLVAPDNNHGGEGDVEAQQANTAAGSAGSSSPLLALQDLAGYRHQRIKQQREEAATSARKIQYGKMEHSFACMEIALFLGVFGLPEEKYKKAPRAYARAFFMEERLPVEEGWVGRGTRNTKQSGGGWRSWWRCRRSSRRLGWPELIRTSSRVRKAIGKI